MLLNASMVSLANGYSRAFARYLPSRWDHDEALLPTRQGQAAFGLLVVFLVLLALFANRYLLFVATLAGIGVVGALGLNLLTGATGQISLGHAAFLGVGAYTAALAAQRGLGLPWTLLAGGGLAAAVGLVLGLPSLRIKGLYLAISTLAFQMVMEYVFVHWDAVTGGIRGLQLPAPALAGLPVDAPARFFCVVASVAVLLGLAARRLLSTQGGRFMVAVRDNDLAAEVVGVPLLHTKLLAFGVAAFYGGVAGALWAHFFRAITPEHFPLSMSISFLAMIIVGGLGTVAGSVLGALFITLVPEGLNIVVGLMGPRMAWLAAPLREVSFGLLILLFLIAEPTGLAGLWRRFRDYLRTWPLPY